MPYIKLLRVKHWIKNLLVLFPLAFSGLALDGSIALMGLTAFASFCFMSSAVYIFNDIRDVEADRLHPRKRERPIASGQVSIAGASAIALLLALASLALAAFLSLELIATMATILAYMVLNLGYSLGWKNVPVADIAILASGFLLRVLFGGFFCAIPISSWLFLSVLSLSFFLALGKRRGELKRHGSASRKSLEAYTLPFLASNMYVYLGLGLAFYSLWTFERIGGFSVALSSSSALFVSGIPLVMLICLRYSLDVERPDEDGDPVEVILHDKALLVLGALWVADMLIGVYAFGGAVG